jgi:hypothetical protein
VVRLAKEALPLIRPLPSIVKTAQQSRDYHHRLQEREKLHTYNEKMGLLPLPATMATTACEPATGGRFAAIENCQAHQHRAVQGTPENSGASETTTTFCRLLI